MADRKLKIVMFGHKRIPSREGGIEIVVEELSTRLVERSHQVVCYNRNGHHVSGSQYDKEKLDNYKGVKLKTVWTVEKKGWAALTSSFSAAIRAARSRADIIHIHAEGPAAMCGLIRFLWKMRGRKGRIVVTVHGECEIIGSTGEKPVKSRLHGDPVFYPNSSTEESIHSTSYSGGLLGLCAMPVASWDMRRAFPVLNPLEYVNVGSLCGCTVC